MVKHQTVEPLGSLLPEKLHFAEPSFPEDSAVLKGPEHPLLSHTVIKETNPAAKMLVAAIDPEEDDYGTGQFVYPTSPAHLEGSFDLTGFNVDFDDRNFYFRLTFRALSNPGWHPEYGFQLTYVAIAIDTDGKAGSGRSQVGHNSRFVLPGGFLLDRLILIGGGIQVEDHQERILAAYVPSPQDITNPIGNAGEGTISFAIPREFLGKLNPDWRFNVLVGGQDDHGGAGLGEFRPVDKTAGEWNGGGRISESDPNVYDTLVWPPY
jgi:carbohydrate-binding DOMON domain-containing protein